jgi:group I intron endonuclease
MLESMKTKLAFPGIYEIVHTASGKRYIGNSRNVANRIYAHRYALRNNRHFCPYLQNAWNKHGESAFEFKLIERCFDEVTVLLAREQYWIDKNLKRLYNSRKFSEQFIQDWYRTEQSIPTRQKAAARMKEYRANLKRKLICEQCKEQFITNAPSLNVRFCSAKCRGRFKHINKAHTKPSVCRICGKDFLQSIYKGKSICSRECGFASFRSVTDEQLVEIVSRVVNGEPMKSVAKSYNLNITAINKMVYRESYSHVELPDELAIKLEARNDASRKAHQAWMSDETTMAIKIGLANGEPKTHLSKKFKTTHDQLTKILTGEKGSHVKVSDDIEAKLEERRKAKPYKLSHENLKDIKVRLRAGETHASISRLHGVASSVVTLISLGRHKTANSISID